MSTSNATNLDTDLACDRCDIPLTERQAHWADDRPYCADCMHWLEGRAQYQAEHAEERRAEERGGEK